MSDYTDWLKEQPLEFQMEILKDTNEMKDKFVDEKYRPLTLDELKFLDDKFNN